MSTGAGPLRVLVVDDEPAIRRFLRAGLSSQGYVISELDTGLPAVDVVRRKGTDLIVLDLGLPDIDGTEVIGRIRAGGSAVPIIVLSSRSDEAAKVDALDMGADDYVTKPFSLHEFLARVKARLRRQSSGESATRSDAIAVADIVLDPSRQSLLVRGRSVSLAPKEFSLLHVLMENRGRVVTRQTLLDKVWGYDFEGEHQTISVHVRWLREKIELDPNNPQHIITVRSRGYMFKE